MVVDTSQSADLRIRFLGTADAYPNHGRYNSCIAIETEVATYLLDCGEPCTASLVRAGIDPNIVRSVFVTHAHSDHITGLPTLVDTARQNRVGEPVRVYLPRSAVEGIAAYLALVGTPHKALHAIGPGEIYDDGSVQVEAHVTKHTQESYGFVIHHGQKRIVYSGDLKEAGEVAHLYDGADAVITELAHFEPDELGAALKDCRIGKLFVTHINHHMMARKEEIGTSLQRRLGTIPVHIAYDGLVVDL